jgi:phage shock protein E
MMFRLFSSVLTLLIVLSFSASLWAGEALWIDVRSAGEYNSEHVSAAVNIPYTEISGRIGEVTGDKDALIYVYCRSGRRSGIALETLEEAGYTNVINLGGLQDAQARASEMAAQ